MTSAILSVSTAVPEHRLDAADALEHLRTHFPQLEKLHDREAALGTRYTCEPVADLLASRGLADQSRAYLRHAKRLALCCARKALAGAGISGRDIDLVITVSCTGYLVPSLDVHVAEELGLRPDVTRLPITELGCSAGAAAIAAAHRHLVGHPTDRVLVLAVELPSLSFRRSNRSLDNLTACLVFGDGAGAAVLGSADGRGLQMKRCASYLLPGTADLLGFDLGDEGFEVVLDRRLPRVLRNAVAPIVTGFLEDPQFYVCHAAGPRIFNAVESALGLRAEALDVSRKVFAEVGNTSSASIFFALERVMRCDATVGDGLGLAFGPGISIELMHLSRCGEGAPGPSPDLPGQFV